MGDHRQVDLDRAFRRLETQAVPLYGGELLASCDADHVVSCKAEASSQDAADGPKAVDHEPHPDASRRSVRPIGWQGHGCVPCRLGLPGRLTEDGAPRCRPRILQDRPVRLEQRLRKIVQREELHCRCFTVRDPAPTERRWPERRRRRTGQSGRRGSGRSGSPGRARSRGALAAPPPSRSPPCTREGPPAPTFHRGVPLRRAAPRCLRRRAEAAARRPKGPRPPRRRPPVPSSPTQERPCGGSCLVSPNRASAGRPPRWCGRGGDDQLGGHDVLPCLESGS